MNFLRNTVLFVDIWIRFYVQERKDKLFHKNLRKFCTTSILRFTVTSFCKLKIYYQNLIEKKMIPKIITYYTHYKLSMLNINLLLIKERFHFDAKTLCGY
jgi:hypothetical protein